VIDKFVGSIEEKTRMDRISEGAFREETEI
jgi:hypothetical protein